jgi:hypothetical protein
MKTKDENVWASLLAQSAPAFTVEVSLPYGLTTRVLTAVREQKRQEVAWERVGFGAIFTALTAVAGIALITFVLHDRDDLDPAVKNIALVENVQVS